MLKPTYSFLLLAASVVPGLLWAQPEAASPDVLDMSLEDLLNVEIDSVWGALGYKQKVSNAPASPRSSNSSAPCRCETNRLC